MTVLSRAVNWDSWTQKGQARFASLIPHDYKLMRVLNRKVNGDSKNYDIGLKHYKRLLIHISYL